MLMAHFVRQLFKIKVGYMALGHPDPYKIHVACMRIDTDASTGRD